MSPGCLALIPKLVLQAVEQVHRVRLAHRDVKVDNYHFGLTADGNMALKLLDFGLAIYLPGSSHLQHPCLGPLSHCLIVCPQACLPVCLSVCAGHRGVLSCPSACLVRCRAPLLTLPAGNPTLNRIDPSSGSINYMPPELLDVDQMWVPVGRPSCAAHHQAAGIWGAACTAFGILFNHLALSTDPALSQGEQRADVRHQQIELVRLLSLLLHASACAFVGLAG